MLGFHHYGTFLLFCAFVLLLVSCLTTPLFGPNHDFAIAKATITDRVVSVGRLSVNVKSHLKLGVFGYCYRILGKTDHCSASELGYELPPLFAILGRVTGYADEHAQATIRSTTKAFVLHPLACAISFATFVVAAGSDRCGFLVAAVLTFGAFVVTLATVVVDIVFYYVAKHHVEHESDRVSVDFSFSTGTWL
ncbi:hypothetical protein JCM11491_005671 [Sporobolomyces phaffii]